MTYADLLVDHFQSPRNVGEMAGADAEAEEENPVCGDWLHVWLRIRGERIVECRWQARGCVPAVAAASAMSELIREYSLDQALALDRQDISAALGGLPPRKSHAASLSIAALRKALQQYLSRQPAL